MRPSHGRKFLRVAAIVASDRQGMDDIGNTGEGFEDAFGVLRIQRREQDVQRPAVDPGFSPGQRRLFVKFEELSPPNFFGSNPIPIVVGSTSIAPRAE